MTGAGFMISREQRNDILKAVRAIERQLKEVPGKPGWQAFYVIANNLAVIETIATNLPRATPN